MSTAGAAAGRGFEGGFKSRMKEMAKTIGLTLGAVAILEKTKEIFKESVAAARQQQALNRVTAQVIKTTGGAAKVTTKHVEELATKLSRYGGIEDDVVQHGENILLTFTKVRNEMGKGNQVFDRATTVALDMSVALGQDLKSSTIQIGKALQDPIKGLTALRRVGVTFDDQQKEQIKTLVKSGHSLQAQKLILAELEKEFGGAAKAAATPAQKMHVAWHELLKTIGEKILPIIDKISLWFSQHLLPAIIGILNGTSSWNTALSKMTGFVKDLLNRWPPLVDAIKLCVYWIGVFVATKVAIAAVKGAVDAVRGAWLLLNTAVKGNWIVIVIALVVAALIYAYTHFAWFRDGVTKAWAVIQQVTKQVWDHVLKPVFAALIGLLRTIMPVVKDLWEKGFKPTFVSIANIFISIWQKAVAPYTHQIMAVLRALGITVMWLVVHIIVPYLKIAMAFWKFVFGTVVKNTILIALGAIRLLANVIRWWVVNVTIPFVKAYVTVIIWAIKTIFIPLVRAAINVIKLLIGWTINLKNWSLNVWRAIQTAIKFAWERIIHPTWVAILTGIGVLQRFFNGLWNTVRTVWNNILNWIRSAWNGTIKPIFKAIAGGVTTLAGWFEWLWRKIHGVFDTIIRFANGFKDKLITAFDNAKKGIGKVWDGIKKIVAAPINFVIRYVYREGIKWMWDGIANLVHLPKMPWVNDIKLSSGGVVPGRDVFGRDRVNARLTEGEGVLSVREMDALGGARGFNLLRSMIAGGLPGFKGGGIFGKVGHFLSGAAGFVGDKALDILKKIAAGVLKGFRGPLQAIVNTIPGGNDGFVGGAKRLPRKMLDMAIDYLQGKAAEFVAASGFGGTGVDDVLKFLKAIAGRVPYVLGGVGPTSYDCSGLVGEVWARLTGHPSFRRYFVTGTEGAFLKAHGFVKGADRGGFTVGFNSHHTTGMLAGHNFEAAHSGTTMRFDTGTPATSFPNVFHLVRSSFGVGGKLGQWINEALKFMHLPQSWAGPLATLVKRESGGNPRAVNAQTVMGQHATGLAQTLPSTFGIYHAGGHGNIFNPVDNLIAALRYIISRYHTIFNVQQANEKLPPKGYARGGIVGMLSQIASMDSGGHLVPGWNLIHNGLGRLEPVGAAAGGNIGVLNVALAIRNLQEIRDIEDFLNRIIPTARTKQGG